MKCINDFTNETPSNLNTDLLDTNDVKVALDVHFSLPFFYYEDYELCAQGEEKNRKQVFLVLFMRV